MLVAHVKVCRRSCKLEEEWSFTGGATKRVLPCVTASHATEGIGTQNKTLLKILIGRQVHLRSGPQDNLGWNSTRKVITSTTLKCIWKHIGMENRTTLQVTVGLSNTVDGLTVLLLRRANQQISRTRHLLDMDLSFGYT